MPRNRPDYLAEFVPPPTVVGAYKKGRRQGELGFHRMSFEQYFANAVEEPPWRSSQYRAYKRGHEAGTERRQARLARREVEGA